MAAICGSCSVVTRLTILLSLPLWLSLTTTVAALLSAPNRVCGSAGQFDGRGASQHLTAQGRSACYGIAPGHRRVSPKACWCRLSRHQSQPSTHRRAGHRCVGATPVAGVTTNRVTGRCILRADLQNPGITVRKTVVFMTDQGAILGMMRLNFQSVSVGLKSHIP